ncbi:MAG TPA: tyrosine--tRNA ligase, partial [Dehalococcoidales bacterium]|nr:tyrosine--tRNA ligase [Dehalococcoidales bacterium]
MEPIENQVAVLMQGSEFGDPQIKEMMTRELRQRLTEAAKEGRPLRVYCGYDVTAPDIHLGHTITMRKLRQFQDFGHHVTFVIGTFTTLIGDPSDRDDARTVPTMEIIEKNAKTYTDQAFKILNRQKTTVRFNHEWLSKLTFADVIKAASYFTVQQFLTRDRLRNRYDANKPLWLQELLYPLAQGYDAVHLHTDVQLGATEQLFNLMAGRRLQEAFGQKPLICITFPVLVGTDGVDRMSKSRGNYIGISELPEQQYGKIMSIPDSLIVQYFELLTDISAAELAEFKQAMANNTVNPMELKKRLAREIVTQLNDKKTAAEAEEHFQKVVQKKEAPEVIPAVKITNELLRKIKARSITEKGGLGIIKEVGKPEEAGTWFVSVTLLLTEIGLAKSRSDAKRLIKQESV